eukprot:8856590-Pyramimonas_sp.AAC.1
MTLSSHHPPLPSGACDIIITTQLRHLRQHPPLPSGVTLLSHLPRAGAEAHADVRGVCARPAGAVPRGGDGPLRRASVPAQPGLLRARAP